MPDTFDRSKNFELRRTKKVWKNRIFYMFDMQRIEWIFDVFLMNVQNVIQLTATFSVVQQVEETVGARNNFHEHKRASR